MTFKDGDSSTRFTLGHPWKVEGVGLYAPNEAPEGEWNFDSVDVTVAGMDVTFAMSFNDDGTEATFGEVSDPIPRGTYQNLTLNYVLMRDGDGETLELPIPTLVVE